MDPYTLNPYRLIEPLWIRALMIPLKEPYLGTIGYMHP